MAAGATLLLLAACSAPEAEADGPYAEAARDAQRQATTDFERDVFDDLTVSRDEYEEAVARYVKCIKDAGADVLPIDQGGYYSYQVSGDIAAYDAVADRCSAGTRVLIEPFYVNLVRNPDAQDFPDIVAECFVRHDGVDEEVTGSDVTAYLDASTSGDPLPFEVDAEVFDLCMSNPQN
ncbi:hypothetical protein [Agromyces italicus]|uniref:hypothetical protein n=1 Tax=Agromyces italicus TaxID=279572 RepID=UPI0003B4955B|nr:hypothetical protein [Agromyces italicus]